MHNSVLQAGAIDVVPEQFIEFQSRGRILLIAPADLAAQLLKQFEQLEVFCVTDAVFEAEAQHNIITQPINSLTGWMGEFKAQIAERQLDIDLVLDMSPKPVISTKVPPIGYFAPGDNQQALAEALQQIPELVGVFDKPKFFNYKASICAHGRRGIQACNQCVDACPAEAISSLKESVEVNPSLCQGCGSCVSVCPSGAMSYAYPTLDVSMNRLRSMLAEYRRLESTPAHVIIHDELQCSTILDVIGTELPNSVVLFSIEEIGALGMPFWLAALAYGAASVTVWNAKSHDDHDWNEVQQQLALSQQMIAGMGYEQQRIQWLEATTPDAVKQVFGELVQRQFEVNDAANFAGIDDKRRVITMAMTHLHQHAPQQVEQIALPATAAFGQVNVNKTACTLCMSCVSVCPMGALVDGVDKPQLNFIEDLCVQCGMCETACPEDAIGLQSRYLFDRESTRQKRLLHEEAIFHCIRCAKPFATQKMIDMMTEKLKGHSLFQGAALDRLKMCEDCRVKAMFDEQQGTH